MRSPLACFVLAASACSISPDASAPAEIFVDQPVPPPTVRVTAQPASAAASWREQVLYLVMPDRFFNGDPSNDGAGLAECFRPDDPFGYHGGDLEGLRQKLPYLEALGVTAVWTTPLYRQISEASGRCGYHGYWADFTFPDDGALEPKLGTGAQLQSLVSDLHARNLRFVLDMVVNHSGDRARLPHQRPGWFRAEAGCASKGPSVIYCPLDHHPDFAQELPEVADYLDTKSAGWVQRYGLDGIRMDTAKHVEPSYFKDRWVPAVRAAAPELFLLAEVFDDNPAAAAPYLAAGFDSSFQFGLRSALVSAFAQNGSVDAVANQVLRTREQLGLERQLMLTSLLDNHDVPRFTNLPGVGVPEEEIRRRYHLALAALFTLPGIPQLYYGDELGLYGAQDPDNRRDMPGWAYDAVTRAAPHPHESVPGADGTFDWTRGLIALRKRVAALHSGDYTELWRQSGGLRPNVLAFLRHTADSRALVVLNNDATGSVTLTVPLCANPALDDQRCLGDGQVWEDALGNGPLAVSNGGSFPVQLPARTAALYLPRPPDHAAEVTFSLRASTAWGESIFVDGDVAELRRPLRLTAQDCQGDTCIWRGAIRYLPHGTTFSYRVRRVGADAKGVDVFPSTAVTVGQVSTLSIQR